MIYMYFELFVIIAFDFTSSLKCVQKYNKDIGYPLIASVKKFYLRISAKKKNKQKGCWNL